MIILELDKSSYKRVQKTDLVYNFVDEITPMKVKALKS